MSKAAPYFLILSALFSCSKNSNSSSESSSPIDEVISDVPATPDTSALNLDGIMVSPENFRLLMENKFVRVVEYTLVLYRQNEREGERTDLL